MVSLGTSPAAAPIGVVKDQFHPLPMQNVKLGGHLSEVIDTSIAARMIDPEARERIWTMVIQPFRDKDEKDSPSEASGRARLSCGSE